MKLELTNNTLEVIAKTFSRMLIVFIALISMCGVLNLRSEPETESARQLYNEGTQKLNAGKFQEAEACLQSAISSQDDRVQPRALYNLGETRFKEGAEEFKKGPSSEAANAEASHAADFGTSADRALDNALGSQDLEKMVSAYMYGRGARKELKSAIEAVKRAMEKNGNVLAHWQRASGDFKSAREMVQSDMSAKANADIVDRCIAKLIDQQQTMAMAMSGMAQQRKDLGKKMAGLKKMLPQDEGPKMKGPGDDDDDDDDKPRPQPKEGDQEPGPKNGKEMQLNADEARRLLGMLKLDANRKLSLGGSDQEKKPTASNGRDW